MVEHGSVAVLALTLAVFGVLWNNHEYWQQEPYPGGRGGVPLAGPGDRAPGPDLLDSSRCGLLPVAIRRFRLFDVRPGPGQGRARRVVSVGVHVVPGVVSFRAALRGALAETCWEHSLRLHGVDREAMRIRAHSAS